MRAQLIGFGNIGQGLAKVLLKKRKGLKQRHDLDIKVVSISDITGTVVNKKGVDLKKALGVMGKSGRLIDHPGAKKIPGLEAIEEVDADVVIVQFRFEASVGGAMPILNLARQCLSGDEIIGIRGILNGTTNYILTRMLREESPFEIVLREAQELGIAEADPSYDIDGIDTASKLVILANAIMGSDAAYKDVKVQGIRSVTPEAVKLAKDGGYAIKLIGEVSNNRLEVSPRLVSLNHPLNVEGTLNVATFETDVAGEITIVGKGAGAIETNSAILSDLIDIWKK
jgi:homoserine dehydrogenase